MRFPSHTILTNTIIEAYAQLGCHLSDDHVPHIEPLITPSDAQLAILNEGDGQTPRQYKQVNSSTGLAVNYYKIIEDLGHVENLLFENKVAKPLKCGGRFANLDVSYLRNGKMVFVESKFLEPYYSGNETNRASYFDVDNYPAEVPVEDRKKWIRLFEDANRYEYYNFSQLCRHLLAIYRYGISRGITTPLVLQSVIWGMTDCFISFLKNDEHRMAMRQRVESLKKESISCSERINSFLTEISWSNMSFEALKYNDLLADILDSRFADDFCKRYFMDNLGR